MTAYRDDDPMKEYAEARDALDMLVQKGYSFSDNNNDLRAELDDLRNSVGWAEPSQEAVGRIASLEDALVQKAPALQRVDGVMANIGFWKETIQYKNAGGSRDDVVVYVNRLEKKMGILSDRNLFDPSEEGNAPCFYQIDADGFDKFKKIALCHKYDQHHLTADSIPLLFVSWFTGTSSVIAGAVSLDEYMRELPYDNMLLATAISGAVAILSGSVNYMLWRKEQRLNQESYVQYVRSTLLASGSEAIALATQIPYSGQVQMRVGDVENDEVELEAESEEPKEQQRNASVLAFEIPE